MSAETMKKTKKPFSMKKWVKSRNGQQTIVILSFMIIPLLLLFVFTYLPFGEMVKFSFYKICYPGRQKTVCRISELHRRI